MSLKKRKREVFTWERVSVFIFISMAFFFSANMTGAVVGSAKNDFSLLGIVFFIGGLVFTFICCRRNLKS